MMIMVRILITVAIVLFVLFLLSLFIYFFNLDMKAASKMIPIMTKYYDRSKAKRERRAKKEETHS